MNNIDNDIEQFEKNLVEINDMRGQLSSLCDRLEAIANDTKDINEIKDNLNKEIESIKQYYNELDKKEEDRLNTIKTNIDNKIKESTDNLTKEIVSLKNGNSNKFIILAVLLIINILIVVISLFVK